MKYLLSRKYIIVNTLLLPIITCLIILSMSLVAIMTVLRVAYQVVMGALYFAALINVPILAVCAVNPQNNYIRPMLVVDILLCLFVFPLLIFGYDWILNKLTGGFVERSRLFKDSPIYHKNR